MTSGMIELRERVRFVAKPLPVEYFSRTAWPHKYAVWFVRDHESVIPDEVWEAVGESAAQPTFGLAERAMNTWIALLGVKAKEAEMVLARAYLAEHLVIGAPGADR